MKTVHLRLPRLGPASPDGVPLASAARGTGLRALGASGPRTSVSVYVCLGGALNGREAGFASYDSPSGR